MRLNLHPLVEVRWKVSVAERLLDPGRGGVNRDMTGAGGGHVTGRKFHIQHMFEFCIASIHFKMSLINQNITVTQLPINFALEELRERTWFCLIEGSRRHELSSLRSKIFFSLSSPSPLGRAMQPLRASSCHIQIA